MLQEIKLEGLEENPFKLFESRAVAAAGDEQSYNGMTVGWGTMGILWNKNVVTVYIRPQRYTRELMDKNDKFSLCFSRMTAKKPCSATAPTRAGMWIRPDLQV